DTLSDSVEPFLLRAGLVVRTPRGRKLTASGYEHLGQTPPDATQANATPAASDEPTDAMPLFE
ncbi:MAG: Holliday junction DNA helicase RuvB C-terminal domain-containing protein, partial [Planctomycetota bacterium]